MPLARSSSSRATVGTAGRMTVTGWTAVCSGSGRARNSASSARGTRFGSTSRQPTVCSVSVTGRGEGQTTGQSPVPTETRTRLPDTKRCAMSFSATDTR